MRTKYRSFVLLRLMKRTPYRSTSARRNSRTHGAGVQRLNTFPPISSRLAQWTPAGSCQVYR